MAPLEEHMNGPTNGHFDEMACLLYLDGQLDRDRAAELLRHTGACPACRKLLTALEEESRLLRGALVDEDEAVPARLMVPQSQDRVPWGWFAGLGFAGAGAYTFVAELWEPLSKQLETAGFGQSSPLAMLFFGGVFWKGWDSIMTLINILALGTLGGVLLYLWRRSRLRVPSLAVVFGALFCLLCLPAPAAATEIKKAESYTLPAGETIKGDLIVVGNSIRIDGTVEGDLFAFGADLTVNGQVKGDIISFSRTARIEGQVDGDIRTFGNTIIVNGNVTRSATLFAETLRFDSKSQIGGSIMSFGQSVSLDGRVTRDLLSYSERAEINGYIGGSADLSGNRLAISSGAEILGPVEFKGNKEPEVSSQAKLAAGPVKFKKIEPKPKYSDPRFYWRKTLSWGAGLMFGVLLILLMPDFMKDSVRQAGRYGPAFGAGAVTLVATPILAIIACITVVGLAIGIAGVLLYAVALFAAQIFVGLWLGERILGRAETQMATIGRLAVGLLIVRIAGNLPQVSGLIWLVVLAWGLGAMTLAIGKKLRPEPAYVPSEPSAPLPAASV